MHTCVCMRWHGDKNGRGGTDARSNVARWSFEPVRLCMRDREDLIYMYGNLENIFRSDERARGYIRLINFRSWDNELG